jgi:hypothetical protein
MRGTTMRTIRTVLVALLIVAASAAAAWAAPPDQMTPMGNKRQAVTTTPRTMASMMQVSGDFVYGHNPGGGDYAVKGAWGDGTVLEARGYYVERGDGKVYVATRWRTRRGTTAVLSDWNTGGSNSATYSEILSFTTGFFYGHREDYPDYVGTSSILLQSTPDCSQVAGVDNYLGGTFQVTANPQGANPVSGLKDQSGANQSNNILDCGEQA